MNLSQNQKIALGVGGVLSVIGAVWYLNNQGYFEPGAYYQEDTQKIPDFQSVSEQSLTTIVPQGSNNSVSNPDFMTIFVG